MLCSFRYTAAKPVRCQPLSVKCRRMDGVTDGQRQRDAGHGLATVTR